MPERAQIVIANTTPLIALAEIHHLDLLRHLYGEILVPRAVQDEIMAGGSMGIGVKEFQTAEWIHAVEVKDARRPKYFTDLDRGEAEVVALAEEMKAERVIIDELLGRKHARRLGFEVTGSIGVLIKAKQAGILIEIAPLFKAWEETGRLWISEDLKKEALRRAGE